MKYLAAFLFLFSSLSFSQTVINYDDGSTYTLENNEHIFVTTHKVYSKSNYKRGGVHFKPVNENKKRDYVPDPDGTDDMVIGSHEWCLAYVPWHEGLTFDMISWQRSCDTNGDDKYNENDEGWEG